MYVIQNITQGTGMQRIRIIVVLLFSLNYVITSSHNYRYHNMLWLPITCTYVLLCIYCFQLCYHYTTQINNRKVVVLPLILLTIMQGKLLWTEVGIDRVIQITYVSDDEFHLIVGLSCKEWQLHWYYVVNDSKCDCVVVLRIFISRAVKLN